MFEAGVNHVLHEHPAVEAVVAQEIRRAKDAIVARRQELQRVVGRRWSRSRPHPCGGTARPGSRLGNGGRGPFGIDAIDRVREIRAASVARGQVATCAIDAPGAARGCSPATAQKSSQ